MQWRSARTLSQTWLQFSVTGMNFWMFSNSAPSRPCCLLNCQSGRFYAACKKTSWNTLKTKKWLLMCKKKNFKWVLQTLYCGSIRHCVVQPHSESAFFFLPLFFSFSFFFPFFFPLHCFCIQLWSEMVTWTKRPHPTRRMVHTMLTSHYVCPNWVVTARLKGYRMNFCKLKVDGNLK